MYKATGRRASTILQNVGPQRLNDYKPSKKKKPPWNPVPAPELLVTCPSLSTKGLKIKVSSAHLWFILPSSLPLGFCSIIPVNLVLVKVPRTSLLIQQIPLSPYLTSLCYTLNCSLCHPSKEKNTNFLLGLYVIIIFYSALLAVALPISFLFLYTWEF